MDIVASKAIVQKEDEGRTVHLRDHAGEKMFENDKAVTITVAGVYSATYRRAMEGVRDRNFKRRGPLSGEVANQNALSVVAACILAWEGFTKDGREFPLNQTNAAFLLDTFPWIREQVEAAMSDHAEFFQTPLASSPDSSDTSPD